MVQSSARGNWQECDLSKKLTFDIFSRWFTLAAVLSSGNCVEERHDGGEGGDGRHAFLHCDGES